MLEASVWDMQGFEALRLADRPHLLAHWLGLESLLLCCGVSPGREVRPELGASDLVVSQVSRRIRSCLLRPVNTRHGHWANAQVVDSALQNVLLLKAAFPNLRLVRRALTLKDFL